MLNHSIKVLGDDFRRIQHMALFIQHVAAKYGMAFPFQSRRERRHFSAARSRRHAYRPYS